MFIFFTNSLNENELHILNLLIAKAKVYPYAVYQIEKNTTFDSLPDLKDNVIVLVHDETKAKSAFIKRLEDKYGKNFAEVYATYDIPKPSTFLKNTELADKAWDQIKNIRSLIDIKSIVLRGISNAEEAFIGADALLKGDVKGSMFRFKTENGSIDIVPVSTEFTDKSNPTLTYEELMVLYYAKSIFNFSQVDIFSVSN